MDASDRIQQRCIESRLASDIFSQWLRHSVDPRSLDGDLGPLLPSMWPLEAAVLLTAISDRFFLPCGRSKLPFS